ncbi:uncharacterized protein LOC143035563 [Oratosquilla oratoria]|uniref:uncharacterized protein LOC143035563 n=1 Tax=Oratosquilla oratoria TaxID=337810 RepID=UPI003F76663C
MLKECATTLSHPLLYIFEESLTSGAIPDDWGKANITPIFKKGSKMKVLNYCPHGFQSGRSCLTQLLKYFQDLEDAIEAKEDADVIYLDCKKAFDTVPHQRLFNKLKAVGTEGDIWRWIQVFLENRKQRVAIRGVNSGWLDVWSGVPQDVFPLQSTTEEKDLGVYVTPDTSPTEHISKAAAKANSMLGKTERTFTCMDKEIFLALFPTLVRPYMEYAVQAWSPYKKKDINIWGKFQRRATKLVPQLSELPYNERLDALGLTTLQERRTRSDMTEVFKMLNGDEDIDCSQFLQIEQRKV